MTDQKEEKIEKSDFKAVKLKDGEEILLVVRQTPVAFSSAFLIGLFLFLLPFFFLFPLFSWGKIGMVIFFILLGGAILFALYELINWYFNCGIITSLRVIDIDQKGLFNRIVSEVPYYKIDDVSYNIKGIKQSMFRYGNVVVAIRGYRSSVTLRNVAKPAMIQELVLEVERRVRKWDENEEKKPVMDKIMDEMDKLSSVEKRALALALKKMKKE
ncbi:PH domain-containing protein [Candidatus Parcubacteria bacterium]|nr:PH domain-containing protein [Patescibacteria group bacterium]MCG2694278.1 PH domain-containing protein [Candidatus Parcubacteria bacterium]